jgi:hypothetical protein
MPLRRTAKAHRASHEQGRGIHGDDSQHAIDEVAKAMQEAAEANPCTEIVKRATALRTLDHTLTEGQAIEQVRHGDPALHERYRTRDPKRHQWPEVRPVAKETMTDEEAWKEVNTRLAHGEAPDAIARGNPELIDGYRRHHIKQGLVDHHAGRR